jgi:NAD(P)-dependent dehydrogenase (short-subunit alcohol dehydrogenase family)
MAPRLYDKRCLIVGGTSGIGLAAAQRFAQEGARLIVAGLDCTPHAPREESHLTERDDYTLLICDATSATEVEALFAETVKLLGGLDVLYHVAGSSGRKHGDGPLHECTDAGWHATLDANLKSVFLTNRAAIRQFLKQGTGGAILNIASILAISPAPQYFDTAAYTASKGGVIALSRLAAARYATDKIRVNVLAPGVIDTPMAARATSDPAIHAFLQSKQPLGPGAGTPEDCVGAALFLCSDEARFITGAVLPIDGGWSVSEGTLVPL